MPKLADRVKETSTTTGTGTYSLAGAATGYRAFSAAFATADTVYYCVEDGTDWEVGIGTLTTGTPWTLARTTILASSNAGAAVNWAAGTRNVFCTAAAGALAGKETLWIPAGALTARTTNGPAAGSVETTTNKVMVKTLDYDQTTAEYAQFSARMPKGWNRGTITAYFLWSSAISGTNAVVWGLQAVAISDDDALDAAFGTAQTVTDAQTAVGDLMQTAETSAITIGGTPAANDLVVFQVYRDAANGSDTLAGDARLHGVALIYTTEAAVDA